MNNAEDKLKEIVKHVCSKVPFYIKYAEEHELDINNVSIDDFNKLPLVTKDMVMDNPKEFTSSDCNRYLYKKNLTVRRTSGSTGRYLKVYWNAHDDVRSLLGLWYRRKKFFNIVPSDKYCFFYTTDYAYNRFVAEYKDTIYIVDKLLGFSKINLTPERIYDIYLQMKQFQPVWIMMQPSIAMLLAEVIRKQDLGRIDSLRYIELTGEYLTTVARDEISETFQCEVANQYGCNEVNSIASDCTKHRLHVQNSGIYVEILKDGEPVKNGEEGDIYITSFHNHAMPFVRYKIGERGILHDASCCDCGNTALVLELLNGRESSTIITRQGNRIPAYIFLRPVEYINEKLGNIIRQFQVVQNGIDDFTVYIVLKKSYANWNDEIKNVFVREIRDDALKDAQWNFVFRDVLIPENTTGKLSYFVCACKGKRVDDGKPFIKLFKTPRGYYFFDVNTNEIVSIKEDVYEWLEKLLISEDIPECEPELSDRIEALRSKGYLSDNKISVIKHPATEYVETYLERKINKMTLQLTQNCNLRCSYCIYSDFYNENQRTHTGKRMSFEVAKKAVDFLIEHSLDNDSINIGFYGGEPILEFELIKKIVEYTDKVMRGKPHTYSMTTNGTLLNLEIIDFLVKHDVQLMISMDGPEEIHNISRRFAGDGKGSYSRIIESLNLIYEHYPQYAEKVRYSMVMDPQNSFDTINEIFKGTGKHHFENIQSTIIDDTYSVEKISYSSQFIQERNYSTFLAYLAELGRLNKKYVSPISWQEVVQIENKMSKMVHTISLPKEGMHSGPCIPGQLRVFVDVEGNFYPCERVSETSSVMRIGNLEEGFDYTKVKALLNIGKLTEAECRDCWAVNHCTLCAKYADDGNCLSREMKLSHCKDVRAQAVHDIRSMIMLSEMK